MKQIMEVIAQHGNETLLRSNRGIYYIEQRITYSANAALAWCENVLGRVPDTPEFNARTDRKPQGGSNVTH